VSVKARCLARDSGSGKETKIRLSELLVFKVDADNVDKYSWFGSSYESGTKEEEKLTLACRTLAAVAGVYLNVYWRMRLSRVFSDEAEQ
jgi:hypothetical protein